MLRELRDAAAISEFVSGYHGDCGECAELCALHSVDPARYPLDAAALSAIVKRDISQGWASANGSEPMGSIANDLHTLGIPYTNDGYAEPFTVDWQGVLNEWGGVKPLIFEYAHAGHLPGDESGVNYHFNTCVAWDPTTQSGLFADGDNAAAQGGKSGLAAYTLADLEGADVCGLLVIEVQATAQWVRDSTGAHDISGQHIGMGLADLLFAKGLDTVAGACGETYAPNGAHWSYACLADGTVLYWNGSAASINGAAPLLMMASLYHDLVAANAAEESAESGPNPALQAAVAEVNKAAADLDAVVHVSGPSLA